jgi:hypothetical protein
VCNWIAHVKVLGATEIVFQTYPMRSTKWPVKEAMARFENYIKPMPFLFDLPCREGTDGDGKIGSTQVYDLQADLERLGVPLPRMRTPLHVGGPRTEYTVTIRETFHNPFKNSDRALWHRFAEAIGAYVIEDTTRTPITLYERVGRYAAARMNFGVPNGPMAMLYYTPWPFRIFADPLVNAKSYGGHRIKIGDQVPWLLPDQRIVWEKATLDNLMREFEQMEIAA